MAYGGALSEVKRMPASDVEKSEIISKLNEHRKSLIGDIDTSHCEEQRPTDEVIQEVIDRTFFDLVKTCQVQAVEESEEETNAANPGMTCHPNIVTGIKQEILPIMAEKSEDKENYVLTTDGAQYLDKLRKALEYKQEIENFVFNNHYSEDERREVLYTYIENILIPTRSLLLISMPDDMGELKSLYASLFPEFPKNLFEDYENLIILEIGPNSHKVPFFVKLKELNNDKATIEFNNLKRLALDIADLMETSTFGNYFRALRRSTILMMLSQIQFYDAISGKESEITIPRSCGSALNGNMPTKLLHEYDQNKEYGTTLVTNIIQDYRLAYNDESSLLEEFYNSVQNVDIDPIYDAFGQITPFEELRNSEIALGMKNSELSHQTKLDDIAHYDKILGMLDQKVQALYDEGDMYRYSYNRGQIVDRDYIGLEIWKQITAIPEEGEVYKFEKDGVETTFTPSWDNLSVYLANYMKRKKSGNIEEVISQDIKSKLESNTVRIDLPVLYGSPVWRQWALGKIAFAFEEIASDEVPRDIVEMFENFCIIHKTRNGNNLCDLPLTTENEENFFSEMASKLALYRNSNNYVPLDRLEEDDMPKLWPIFQALWHTSYFDQYRSMSEYEFLMAQLYAGNPWARLRLGYLIADEELREQPRHYEMGYDSRLFGLGKVPNKEGQCFNAAMIEEISKFNSIGRITGLKNTLNLHYGETLLKRREINSLWEGIRDEVEERGKHLFTTKRSDNKEYHQVISKVAERTIVDKASLDSVKSNIGNLNLDERAKAEIEEIFQTERGKRGDFFMGLYRLRGDMDRQLEYYTNYLSENDISVDTDIKFEFVRLDNLIKNAVYKSLLRESAVNRRAAMINQLDEVCQFAPDNHDELKTFFYMTAKAQNEINEITGRPAVPEEVLERIEAWTPGEKWSLAAGLFAGVVGIGAFIVASACTASIICGIAGAAALSAVFIQGGLAVYEYRKFTAAKTHTSRILKMEELGLTDRDNYKKMKHGWFMMAFEIVSIFPMLGPSLRGLELGGRMIKGLPVLYKSGMRSYKEVLTASHEMADIRYALAVLKRGLSEEDLAKISRLEKELAEEIEEVMTQKQAGLISRRVMMQKVSELHSSYMTRIKKIGDDFMKMLDDEVISMTQREVDDLTIFQLKNYHKNLDNFKREFQGVSGKKLTNAIDRMENKIESATGVRKWFMRMRSEHLFKFKETIVKVQNNLDEALANGKSVEDFMRENLDDLNIIYTKRPFELKTLPHMLTGQGATHGMEFGMARFEQSFGGLADSLLTKKIFQARDRVSFEAVTRESKVTLDLPEVAGSVKAYKVIRQFNMKVTSLLDEMNTPGKLAIQMPQRTRIMTEYQGLQDEATRAAFAVLTKHQKANGTYTIGRRTYTLDEATVKRVLFNPRNTADEVLAERLWGAIDIEKVFDIKPLGNLAHEMARSLSNYGSINQYMDFLSACRVLIMKAKPEVVDFI